MAALTVGLAGLALLPLIFFYITTKLPAALSLFRIVFIVGGLLSILILFNQISVSAPTMAETFGILSYLVITVLVLFLLWEMWGMIAAAFSYMQEKVG